MMQPGVVNTKKGWNYMNGIEEYINFYRNQGFSVIPLREKDKRPNITSWEKYQKQKPTNEEIQAWMENKLFQNVGVICGHVSNDLVIIDIDDESIPGLIGIEFDKILKSGAWPVKTGKGYQIYLKHHSNPGQLKRLLKYKIEYRANNGYCVAPPSIHPNGEKYYFIDVKREDLPRLKKKDVKSIFNDFKERIGKKWNIKEKTAGKPAAADSAAEYPKCIEKALKTITKHPMRYNTIYGIASSFYMNKIPYDMALKKIKQFNMEKCIPPKKNEDVENAVKGAYQTDSKKFGCEFWMDQAELCPFENITECPYGNKKAKKELAKQYKIYKYAEKEINGENVFVRVGIIYPQLAELIINEYDFNFFTTNDTKEIYYYKEGFYHPDGENIIREISEEYMEKLTSKHGKNEIVDYIRDKNYKNRNIFSAPKKLIPLQNGVFDIEKKELLPHGPEYFFLNNIPINYDPNAKSQKVKKFLSEVVEKKDLNAIQELFGYCLYRDYPFHKAFMFLGAGKNGKSTVINLLKKFLGENNTSNKELQELSFDRFATSKLYGKLLNAAADISDAALHQTGKFKTLTGGDMIDAQKKFQDSFNFKNYAKLLYSANTLPKTDDDSYAFYRRWILINFPNTFEGKKCDPHILEKITKPEELSGLLNYALEGLYRLLKNNGFSYSKTVEETREQYKTLSDPVYSFVQKFIGTDTTGFLLKDNVYGKYIEWCKKKDLPTIPKNMFSQDLGKHIPNMRAGRKRIDGRLERVYNYICWKKDGNENNNENQGNPAQDFQQEGLY